VLVTRGDVGLTVFGDLRIAATPRGGAVGPFVGAPVSDHWPWYWHLPGLGRGYYWRSRWLCPPRIATPCAADLTS